MTDPQGAEPTTPAPSHNQMVTTAYLGIDAALESLTDCYRQWATRAAAWPDLAAALQHYGQALVDVGVQFADDMAAYSAANPTVMVPEGGVGFVALTGHEHESYWRAAWEARSTPDLAAALAAYADAFSRGDYGRPELSCRAVPIGDTGALLLLQYLTEQGPDAVVRAYLGGVARNDDLMQALDDQGVTISEAPVFWPPTGNVWVLMFNDMFDQYGRRVPPERYTPRAPATGGGQDAPATSS